MYSIFPGIAAFYAGRTRINEAKQTAHSLTIVLFCYLGPEFAGQEHGTRDAE